MTNPTYPSIDLTDLPDDDQSINHGPSEHRTNHIDARISHHPLNPSSPSIPHITSSPSSSRQLSQTPLAQTPSSLPTGSRQDYDIEITGTKITSLVSRFGSHLSPYPSKHTIVSSPYRGTMNGNGPSGSIGSNGSSAEQAIDLTNVRLPSPPPLEQKKPLCIGAVQSRAIMLYPSHAAVVGAQPLPGSREKFMTLMYHGAELLRVKLKVSWEMIARADVIATNADTEAERR